MKFVKGKAGAGSRDATDAEAAAAGTRVVQKHRGALERLAKQSPNPWIDRRLFDLMEQRAVQAENMCKDLIGIVAVDDGEFLASHGGDWLVAGEAIKKGDV